MKILIFGATGGTGQELVKQSLEKGYEVSVFVRKDASKLDDLADKVTVFIGDVLDIISVKAAMSGHDAVLVALGTIPGKKNQVLSIGTKNIVDAMQDYGVKRLIVETGAGLLENKEALPAMWRITFNMPPMSTMFKDKIKQEQAIRDSKLDWTIVRPVNLTNGPLTSDYLTGEIIDLKLSSTVSRANVANFMVKQVESTDSISKALLISDSNK